MHTSELAPGTKSDALPVLTSSYLTWVVILVLIVVSQLFGFFEKVRSFAVVRRHHLSDSLAVLAQSLGRGMFSSSMPPMV